MMSLFMKKIEKDYSKDAYAECECLLCEKGFFQFELKQSGCPRCLSSHWKFKIHSHNPILFKIKPKKNRIREKTLVR